MTLAVIAALAGGLGAVLRYLADGAVQDRVSGPFPWGTATVNLAGAFVLGVVTALVWHHHLSAHVEAVVGTGFCGGLTTWSTASWESVRLVEGRLYRHAFAYALGGLLAASLAAGAGIAIASV